MKNTQILLSFFLIIFISSPAIPKDNFSVRYEFSVLFLAKTCDIDVPKQVILGNQAGYTTVNDIKNDKVSTDIIIKLQNCSAEYQKSSLVYLSSGNTLTGSNNFFNNDPNGVIGVQILDGNRVINYNSNPLSKPSEDSIIWKNIENKGATKLITAKLRCAESDCNPEPGEFSATLSLNYYAN